MSDEIDLGPIEAELITLTKTFIRFGEVQHENMELLVNAVERLADAHEQLVEMLDKLTYMRGRTSDDDALILRIYDCSR